MYLESLTMLSALCVAEGTVVKNRDYHMSIHIASACYHVRGLSVTLHDTCMHIPRFIFLISWYELAISDHSEYILLIQT